MKNNKNYLKNYGKKEIYVFFEKIIFIFFFKNYIYLKV